MTTRFHTSNPIVNEEYQRSFPLKLLRWYKKNRRDLPWRNISDPYKIWVSEIMLQQTRVAYVLAYYKKWIRVFPTVRSLALAPYSEVLSLWEGLGYYNRVRKMHQTAKIVLHHHCGQFPTSSHKLKSLPGIGRYTAGAIASIAFSEKTAHTLVPTNQPGDFNQALMELGSLVCIPRNPSCHVCPIKKFCIAYASGNVSSLPNKGPRLSKKRVSYDVVLHQDRSRLLLQRRPSSGVLAGFWELPTFDPYQFNRKRVLGTVRFSITNTVGTYRILQCTRIVRSRVSLPLRWFRIGELRGIPMPAAHRKALKLHLPVNSTALASIHKGKAHLP